MEDSRRCCVGSYSGSNSQKLAALYPKNPFLKIWKLRLSCMTAPKGQEDNWTCDEIRGPKNASKVYLYNKMTLYIFGGEMYFQDAHGCLIMEEMDDCPEGKSFINLGPSTRPSKRKQPDQKLVSK